MPKFELGEVVEDKVTGFKAVQGKKRETPHNRERRALLAKVHIAKKELDIEEDDYRDLLEGEYGVRSAADMSNLALRHLVSLFKEKGWQPRTKKGKHKGGEQVEALRKRAREMAGQLEDGDKRLRGLVKKVCGVEDLEWCGEAVRLKQLLAWLNTICEKEGVPQ